MKTIFYNSSLPRSGSTLIQNIIAQNPDFYTTPTSGLVDLVMASKNNYNHSQAFIAQDQKQMENAFLTYCKSGMQGYFRGLTDKHFVVDKSREWGVNYGLLNMIFPNPKIICMVRDIRCIYA
jgi:sulfotransferase